MRRNPMTVRGREDLRELPLVTIDPSDARDHDDAVFAEADDDPANRGAAISSGSPSPMWPITSAPVPRWTARHASAATRPISRPRRADAARPGDLCSLHEGLVRPVLAVRMVLDAGGGRSAIASCGA